MDGELDLWEGEYTYRCILTNDYDSSTRDIIEFYNKRGGKERIFDDMNNGFGWNRLPKSFMAENTVFLLLTALIHNFYKTIISKLDTKAFGLKETSRIKAFVFRFISVPAKWIMTARKYVLNIYTENRAYARPFKNWIRIKSVPYGFNLRITSSRIVGEGKVCTNRTKIHAHTIMMHSVQALYCN